MKTALSLFFWLALATCGPGCKTARVTAEQDFREADESPSFKPSIIYVADFELWAADIKQERGILSGRPGPAGRAAARLSGESEKPAERAQELVELMGNSLVKELSKAGFNAKRVLTAEPFPSEGWLLRGVFTEVQEGNRLRRAMIGFGEGQTDIQVVANVQDLSHGPPKPVYEVATDATSGNTPGAAPTLVLGPYGAAAKFVMAGKDLEKNVKQTAAKIAESIANPRLLVR